METVDNDRLAFIKYEGSLVESGYLDAKKSAQALIGFDEALRYFVYQEEPEFQNLQFEIPVKIEKGSWEAWIPHNIGEWIKTTMYLGGTIYASTAMKKLAENDFKDKTTKDIFKSAIRGMKWVIKIGIHLGSMAVKKFENVKFKDGNNTIGIQNDKGEILYLPKKYLEMYINCPDKLFSKMTSIIEENRNMAVGFNKAEVIEPEDLADVKITPVQKYIFSQEEVDLDEVLFPELKHNDYVELEGHVTRGNENSNTIGFQYNGHILTCYPNEGNINKFKNLLFTNCIIKGFVDRNDKDGNYIEKRPRIRFVGLIPNTRKDNSLNLF